MCYIVSVRIIFSHLAEDDRKICLTRIYFGRDVEYEAELAEAVSVNIEIISLPRACVLSPKLRPMDSAELFWLLVLLV